MHHYQSRRGQKIFFHVSAGLPSDAKAARSGQCPRLRRLSDELRSKCDGAVGMNPKLCISEFAMQSDFDGDEMLAGPAAALVTVHANVVRQAQDMIESCEQCNAEGAEIPFDNILDRVTGSDPSVTDYILEAPAKCPLCFRQITEKTLVEPE
jgi:hypothetical protein